MNVEAFFKITYGLYVVSTAFDKKLNGFVSNTVFQITSEPACFAISCSKDNYSTEMIVQSQAFGISALQKETGPNIIGTFGFRTGKDTDKFSKVNYKIGKTGSPILLENSLAWFDCQVVKTIDTGSHMLFIGKVIDGDLINATGEPLTYAYYREVKKGKAPKNAPTFIDPAKINQPITNVLPDSYYCTACGHVYDPSVGDPESGILPGTSFEDLPDNWVCYACGMGKEFFAKKI
jgi:flavin reductase (DIM6/NTAB) family NADH-FMN oxidoreductase RutF/rubredoxin